MNAQKEFSAMLSTFIKLPVVIKTFILSNFEWPFYTGFTAFLRNTYYSLALERLTKLNGSKSIISSN